MMSVRRYNYPAQLEGSLAPLLADIERTLLEGGNVLGKEVERFESAFATYLGVPHVRGLNSGTDALILALMSVGIGRGDEVITQANTFHATVAAVCLVGATPVLVDVEPETFLIDPEQVESVLTSRTRAIIPVHLYGKPCRMGPLLALAAERGLVVIEDAAQAHGARIDGKRVGTFGSFGCFSFHPSKNLAAAGDGGAVATPDSALADEVDRRRSLGQQGQNNHVAIGLNTKLDAIQALVLQYKLINLDAWNASRRAVAGAYRSRLEACPVSFQREDPGEEHVYHLLPIRSTCRDSLLSHLTASGVEATIRYPVPIHLQPAFADFGWRKRQFPVAERLCEELLCLPIRPDMTEQEVDWVGSAIESFYT